MKTLFPITAVFWLLLKSSRVDKTVILLIAQGLHQGIRRKKSLVKFLRNSREASPTLLTRPIHPSMPNLTSFNFLFRSNVSLSVREMNSFLSQ